MAEYTDECVEALMYELHQLLEANILKDPGLVGEEMERAREIEEKIEALGYLVLWQVELDPENPEIPKNVVVNVHKPKDDLPDEYRRIYEAWWKKALERYKKNREH